MRPAQLDEPVLSEVVFTGTKNTRSFMCGALSEKADAQKELELAQELINAVVRIAEDKLRAIVQAAAVLRRG